MVGLRWEEAKAIADSRGLPYKTVLTAPPNRPIGTGDLRVVAQRPLPQGLLLVLAHREYERSQ